MQKEPCAQGTPIKKGQTVRLFHGTTQKWLHSHLVKSPITQQQEVSAFGSPAKSDTGDWWVVTWDGPAKTWQSSEKVCRGLTVHNCCPGRLCQALVVSRLFDSRATIKQRHIWQVLSRGAAAEMMCLQCVG